MGSARSLRPVGVAPRRSGITATDRYVAAIHALAFPLGHACGALGRPFGTARLAEVLGVVPVSAREVLLRLERDGLVERALRRRWALTAAGLARADDVVRRQRIVVRFLVEELAFPVADAYVDGVPLGVSVGARTAERMLERIGAPDHDPNGWPIDLERDRAEAPTLVRAADAPIGTVGAVARLSRHPRSLVAELHEAGCVPGRALRVVAGLGGRPAWLLGDGDERRPLPESLAAGVWLRAVDAR